MHLRRALLTAAIPALLAGCTVGPNYAPPASPVPAAFSAPSPALPDDAVAAWWRGFGDPELETLIARGLAGNLQVRQAAERIAEARAQAGIVGAAALPVVQADAQASETRLSKTTSIGSIASLLGGGGRAGSTPAGLPGTAFSTFQAGFDASWEIDLFGGVRRQVEAARARTEAAEWSARDAEVMIAAEIARSYLQYGALQRRIGLADATIAARAEALDTNRVRARHGLTTTLDERRAERDVAAARAQRQDLVAQRDAQAHALAVLVGEPPLALTQELAAAPAAPAAPAAIPAGLPSDLLRRRPDIRSAERKLAAATADQGAAVAQLYPTISLTGAANLVSGSLANLVSTDSFQPTATAAISWPILDGGRTRANIRLREAQTREAALAYRATVLGALKDVEDALSRLQADRARAAELAAAEASAADAVATAKVRADHGLTTELDWLEARATWLAAGDARLTAEAAVSQDAVALYKALGGGWDGRRIADTGGS